MPFPLAFGITAADRPDHERLGSAVERLGYAELWANDTRRGDGLALLAAAANATRTLRLAVGVVSLTEHSPGDVHRRVIESGIPLDRFTLGVGAGASASLDLVRAGVGELRELLPGVPIAVAAVGPRMLRLAGEIADAVVATWSLPDRVAWIREQVEAGAGGAGRATPRIALYVRTALGPGAVERLRGEMERYRGYGRHYARSFESQPDRPVGVAVESGDPAELAAALDAYRAVADTVVVRGLPAGDAVEDWIALAAAIQDG
jgi:alkanesulfonate monooxygenase SsuD/methylene tetrahydromethanopterin reductase-like flavin-dependent oxidoreductase (luciferase family)